MVIIVWGKYNFKSSPYDCSYFQTLEKHHIAYESGNVDKMLVPNPGEYHWRKGGERHMNDPVTLANLQVTMETLWSNTTVFSTHILLIL